MGLDGPNASYTPYFDDCNPSSFCVFGWFLSKTSRNFTDYVAMSVKHLKLASQSPYVDEQLSPDEIMVWKVVLSLDRQMDSFREVHTSFANSIPKCIPFDIEKDSSGLNPSWSPCLESFQQLPCPSSQMTSASELPTNFEILWACCHIEY